MALVSDLINYVVPKLITSLIYVSPPNFQFAILIFIQCNFVPQLHRIGVQVIAIQNGRINMEMVDFLILRYIRDVIGNWSLDYTFDQLARTMRHQSEIDGKMLVFTNTHTRHKKAWFQNFCRVL